MTKHLLLFFFIFNIFLANSSPIQKEELDQVYALFKTDLDSAYKVSYELLDECSLNDDYYGLVKLNYILAFYHKKNDDVGKSVLHYLEAIRYSEKANYEDHRKDAIALRHNLGNLYRIYKANDLAITYYKEAIEIADWTDERKNILKLKFNLALTYIQADQIEESIALFKELIDVSSESRKNRILNELGLIYKNNGDYESAKIYFNQLLELDGDHIIYSAKALHNLGKIEYELGNLKRAVALTREAIELKEGIDGVDQRSLLISYKSLGDYLFIEKDFHNALTAYKTAEALIEAVQHESLSFELYGSLSQLNYEMGNQKNARAYSHLYSKTVDNYLTSQQSLQETDRQFNMDLITKRYLDEVAKQEQIASILLYSKVISGSLLALLLFTVGLNWYQKVQLRKSIVQDLIKLKVID
ncbi:tetratricopeptide repeat protein [Ekhidna sp.]|uniref:tetratricopeptide repeat protein n=1 Tax=Ekhidna sp. TaxID=2608089 RepID=UPI00329A08AA